MSCPVSGLAIVWRSVQARRQARRTLSCTTPLISHHQSCVNKKAMFQVIAAAHAFSICRRRTTCARASHADRPAAIAGDTAQRNLSLRTIAQELFQQTIIRNSSHGSRPSPRRIPGPRIWNLDVGVSCGDDVEISTVIVLGRSSGLACCVYLDCTRVGINRHLAK